MAKRVNEVIKIYTIPEQGVAGQDGFSPVIDTDLTWVTKDGDSNIPAVGLPGPKGDKGDQGVQGIQGIAGVDGTSAKYPEWRFAKNTSTVAAPILANTQANPSGWTTTQPTLSIGEYLWSTSTVKNPDDSLFQNWSNPIRTNGFDGVDGKDIEFIFKLQSTNVVPPTPVAPDNQDDYIPPGWTDDAQNVTISNPYQFVSKRLKTNNIWSPFDTPALWSNFSKDGTNGTNGQDGATLYTWTRYGDDINGANISASPTGKSYIGHAYNKTTITPSNNAADYIWSLYRGPQGIQGPYFAFTGDYNGARTYTGNISRLEATKYNGNYYVTKVDAGSFSNILPTDTSKWNPIANQFDSVATGLLLASLAYIENLGVRYLRTDDTGTRIEINGDNNTLKFFVDGIVNPVITIDDNITYNGGPGILLGNPDDDTLGNVSIGKDLVRLSNANLSVGGDSALLDLQLGGRFTTQFKLLQNGENYNITDHDYLIIAGDNNEITCPSGQNYTTRRIKISTCYSNTTTKFYGGGKSIHGLAGNDNASNITLAQDGVYEFLVLNNVWVAI